MTEKHYQDGIKLPTDKDEPKWECVNYDRGVNYIEKLKINGGYLYARRDFINDGKETSNFNSSMCFVPDDTNSETHETLLRMIGDLSMKLNKMQDSLLEFEKEKVDPLKGLIGSIDERTDKSIDRIDKLEIFRELYFNEFNILQDWMGKVEIRIQKLEEHHTRQIDENRKVSKILNDTDELLNNFDEICNEQNKKIEKLERELEIVTIGFSERVAELEKYCFSKQVSEFNHPRDNVRLCPHGHPIFESKVNCTACY